MRTYDLILKKRNGYSLSKAEIEYLMAGYLEETIPDYQVAALIMAIYFQGMNDHEIFALTRTIAESGEKISLEEIPGLKVDKHSTGGVGDTTTLVLAPLVAAAGVPVTKLSGRGLGHTGGTLDKLESIEGFETGFSKRKLVEIVKKSGLVIAAQGVDLVPADQKLYALRDVTATVDSIPLIAASIMGKKLAIGNDALVLDVKTGTGAFMKDQKETVKLARIMTALGQEAGRDTVAVISRMDQPLGKAVGNSLEVKEAILTLQGQGPQDLEELCLVLGGWMVYLGGKTKDPVQGRKNLSKLIKSGAALNKFREMVENQGGNKNVVDDLALLPAAERKLEVKADHAGYVSSLDALQIGSAAVNLGAGRRIKTDTIDPAAGIILEKKVGDPVQVGETLAVIHVSGETFKGMDRLVPDLIKSAYRYSIEPVLAPPLICGWIDREGKYHYA